MNIKELDKEYIVGTYGRFDLVAASGSGAVCVDADGKEYIDFTSGIGVNSLGFCDPGWVAAVTEQLGKIQHISNLFYTEPMAKLAEQLVKRTGMKKVFFANSGANPLIRITLSIGKYLSGSRFTRSVHSTVSPGFRPYCLIWSFDTYTSSGEAR